MLPYRRLQLRSLIRASERNEGVTKERELIARNGIWTGWMGFAGWLMITIGALDSSRV